MDSAQRRLVMRRCTGVAGRQYGIITRWQALEAGLSSRQIERLVVTRTWQRKLPGTYLTGAASSSLPQRVMAAVLWAGPSAAAACETACAMRHFANSITDPLEVSGPRKMRAASGVVAHRVQSWGPGDVGVLNGIPVTSVERTLVDMAARELAPRIQELTDEALRRSLTTIASLDSYVRANCGNGRHGPAALRMLLPRYRRGDGYSESILETRLRRLLDESPLPEPVQQFEIHDRGRFVARVDFAWPGSKVAVEAVGRAHHVGRWERDVARLNALLRCGWIVIHVTWEDLHTRPHETLLSIAQALGISL